jgi:acyl carrier protein
MQVTPTKEQVRDRLKLLLGEIAKIPLEAITDSATLGDELHMESVVFVEIQVALEDAYNIELDPIRVIELGEFGAIVDYIHGCVSRDRM